MNKKFWYLTKLSFNKKVKSKWFIATNIILLIAIVVLLNISSIIEFFGGDFDNKTNVLVVDNANAYDIFKTNLENIDTDSSFNILLNAAITIALTPRDEKAESVVTIIGQIFFIRLTLLSY